jgi:hypothetical protein
MGAHVHDIAPAEHERTPEPKVQLAGGVLIAFCAHRSTLGPRACVVLAARGLRGGVTIRGRQTAGMGSRASG